MVIILYAEEKGRFVLKNLWKIILVSPTVKEIIDALKSVLNHCFFDKESPKVLATNAIKTALNGVNKKATAKSKASDTETSAVPVLLDGKTIGNLSEITKETIRTVGRTIWR